MKHRVLVLSLACMASFVSIGVSAQGLRTPGSAGGAAVAAPGANGPRLTSPAAPAEPLPRRDPNAPAVSADFIVAVANSEPITNNELRARIARISQQIQAQGGSLPPRDVLSREVLERLILEHIQLQSARESGIVVDDYAVNQAEQNVALQNKISVEGLHQRLAAEGFTSKTFRQELRNQLTLQRLRERDVDNRLKISDADIDQYLREQKNSAAAQDPEINLGHIFFAVSETATPAQVAERQALAQSVVDQLRAGGDFAALAKQYSDAPEGKTDGGLLGPRESSRYPELFVQATRDLPVGGITGPVRSGAGFHILKLAERDNQGAIPSVVTQSHARHILLRVTAQHSEEAAARTLADYRRRVLAGQADFADLAREHSQDGSAAQGGDLGWASPGQFVPEFEEVMSRLKPGEVSEPLVSRFGVHLIQLLERRQAKLTTREQREMVRNVVREKKLEEAYSNWAQELRGRAYVEYRDPPQ